MARGALIAAAAVFAAVALSAGMPAASAELTYRDVRRGDGKAHRAEAALQVNTTTGPVVGFTAPGGATQQWLGIPFAAPPTESRRFLPPQAADPWTVPLHATGHGPWCPQFFVGVGDIYFGDEDCLHLDVIRPANATADSNLPVMVWLFGGGWAEGADDQLGIYNGATLAARDVIYVAINYRVGALGFAASEAFLAESGTTGNMGLLDQTAALRWVRDNAASFGGNPENVTIFGESAGCFSVLWHLASPSSAGLFHNAICESGAADMPSMYQTLDRATRLGDGYSASVGCNASALAPADWLSCMRALTTAEVLDSPYTNVRLGGVPSDAPGAPLFAPIFCFASVIDGKALTDTPLNVFRSGKFNRANLIIGTNKHEAKLFVPMLYFVMKGIHFPVITDGDVTLAIEHFNNASVAAAAEVLYPAGDFSWPWLRLAQMMTDAQFACPTRRAARAISSHGVPVWNYQFEYVGDFLEDLVMADSHAQELFFVFADSLSLAGIFSPSDWAMSDTFQTAWTNHAKSGNPNGPAPLGSNGYVWPQYVEGNASEVSASLNVPPGVNAGFRDKYCDFWDTVEGRF